MYLWRTASPRGNVPLRACLTTLAAQASGNRVRAKADAALLLREDPCRLGSPTHSKLLSPSSRVAIARSVIINVEVMRVVDPSVSRVFG